MLHVFVVPCHGTEDVLIRFEAEDRAVTLARGLGAFHFLDHFTLGEDDGLGFPVPESLDFEEGREGVYGFDTDAVEANGFFECFGVVFGTGIDFGGAVHELAEGNATSEIADGDEAFFEVNFDGFAVAHRELIDCVVDDFFEEDVDPIVGGRTVAQFAYIHTGADANVFAPLEGFDVFFGVAGWHGWTRPGGPRIRN